jgi:hypothetical protein
MELSSSTFGAMPSFNASAVALLDVFGPARANGDVRVALDVLALATVSIRL